jgi:hypothetical protein
MVAAACMALAGCGGGGGSGGGGSNDNGVSFRALGIFQEVQEQVAPAADTLPSVENHPGDTGRIVSLASTTVIANDINHDGDADGGFIGMQNNLAFESINVEGIHVEIVIPGAVVNPVVTDFVPMAVTLGPAVVPEGQTATNIAFAQTFFVQADVFAFLNQNPSLLPATPYTMNVVMRLTATSDSGDEFTSNEITYGVIVQP